MKSFSKPITRMILPLLMVSLTAPFAAAQRGDSAAASQLGKIGSPTSIRRTAKPRPQNSQTEAGAAIREKRFASSQHALAKTQIQRESVANMKYRNPGLGATLPGSLIAPSYPPIPDSEHKKLRDYRPNAKNRPLRPAAPIMEMHEQLARPLPPSQKSQVIEGHAKTKPVFEASNTKNAANNIWVEIKEERRQLNVDIAQRQAAIALLRDEALQNGSRAQYQTANDMESKLEDYVHQRNRELQLQLQAYWVQSVK